MGWRVEFNEGVKIIISKPDQEKSIFYQFTSLLRATLVIALNTLQSNIQVNANYIALVTSFRVRCESNKHRYNYLFSDYQIQ